MLKSLTCVSFFYKIYKTKVVTGFDNYASVIGCRSARSAVAYSNVTEKTKFELYASAICLKPHLR